MRIAISSRAAWIRSCAFTLVEVVVAAAIVALVFGGIINAYILSAQRAEWSGYSLAAQALSMRALEQARAAKWDTSLGAQVDQILIGSNGFPAMTTTILDLPISITTSNAVRVTNYLSLVNVPLPASYTKVYSFGSTNPYVKMLRSDTVWPFKGKMFTNTVATIIAPDE
jgi:type II secretory pathway pseudopilin PulG